MEGMCMSFCMLQERCLSQEWQRGRICGMLLECVFRDSQQLQRANTNHANTVVSRIHVYAPRFATLTLVESVGGAYMRDLRPLFRCHA